MQNTMLNNDNVVSKRNNNDNVTMNNVRNSKDEIADKLCAELGNHKYRTFYCKVANRLPESIIWNSLEVARKGNDPARYFTWLVKRQMESI